MVGCMMETKLSITAGLSFVAAKKNVMDADLDSFMAVSYTHLDVYKRQSLLETASASTLKPM